MLTIRTVKSGIREKEEYYTEDESLAVGSDSELDCEENIRELTQAVWLVIGTELLGLEGIVTKEDFKTLFYGNQPGTHEQIRGRNTNPKTQERLAEDLTFSAPKSVSMALHLGGDERLFTAQTESVKEVLNEIAQRYITTRIQKNGERSLSLTGNLIAALIPHHTSRDGDLQLHTHAVIMNGTKGEDGEWRSLHNDAMSSQKWLGSLYRQTLARKVQALGYSIYETKDGFEIEGIKRADIEGFSKRSRSIIEQIKKEGLDVTPENRDRATMTTRQAKHITQTLEKFQQQWKAEANSMGVEVPQPLNEPVTFLGFQTVSEALNSAIAHFEERSVTLVRENIYQYVFSHLQSFDLSELDRSINDHPSLISTGKSRFTTIEALEREIETVQQWMGGQGKAAPLLSHPNLEGTKLNSGQREAIALTLTSTDTHQIIHGLSGVGKTTALGELKRQLDGTGIEIRGFSPTIEAAAELQKELGIKTNTVAHLVLAKPERVSNQLWVIDEAGMVGARQMRSIIEKADSVGARILLVGDKGQNSSIEAGSPLKSLIAHGATTHSIRQIVRQQNSIQKQAVELIADGEGTKALSLLNEHGYVTESENRAERAKAIATQYFALSQTEREQTLIVAGTNAERLSLTNAIREGLKAEGQLHSPSAIIQLVSRSLTKEQSKHVSNYQVGDYLSLQRDYHSTPLTKGELYKVEARHGDELTVSSYGGRLYRFNPSKYQDKQVMEAKNLEIAVGDDLRWTATDKDKGRINGQQFTVKAIEGTTMTVEDRQGRTTEVSLLQPLTVDYNLVSTSYRAQGKTAKRVIVSATSDPTSSREPFYVKISRQTKELSVYTQDLSKLKSWVENSNVQKNPLELLGENHERGNEREQFTHSVGPDRETPGSIGKSNPTDSRTDEGSLERLCRSLNRTAITRAIGGLREVVDGIHRVNQQLHNTITSSRHLSGEVGRINEQLERQDRKASPQTGSEFPTPHTEREYRDPQQRLVDAIAQRQIAKSLLLPLTQLSESLQRVKAIKIPALDVAQTQILDQTIQQIEQDSSHTLSQEKLKTLAKAIAQWKIAHHRSRASDSIGEALQTFDRTVNEVKQTSQGDRLDLALDRLRSSLVQDESFIALANPKDGNREQRLAQAIKQRQISQYLLKPLTQLKNALEQSKWSNPHDPLISQLQTLEQSIKRLEQEASHTVSQEKLKTLATAIAQWKIAHHRSRASDSIGEALQTFDRTVNEVKESLKSDRPLNTALEQLRSCISPTTQPHEVFWQPAYPQSPPSHILPHHWEQLINSAIHPDLIALNTESISGDDVFERLLDEKLARMGSGQYVTTPMAREMKKYEQVAEGGWWGQAGINALSLIDLNPGDRPKLADWGCFKPDSPRIDQNKSERKGKLEFRKYENPALKPRVPFLPQVSESLAQKIYEKHGINPTDLERQSGFWYVVKQYPQIPITITEGFKKTLSSLSQGVVTIGLSGVNHIYRSNDSNKNKLAQRELNPEVAVFTQPGREFLFAFDSDTKPTTIMNVRRDRVRGIELLESRGCPCKVVTWASEDGKGLDDLIANKGPSAYTLAHQKAMPSEQDRRIHYRTEYNKIARQVQRELGEIGAERLDLEVYLRTTAKGELADGMRVVGESDTVRFLRPKNPETAEYYLQAVEAIAGLYDRLSRKDTIPDLDETIRQAIERQMVALELEKEAIALKASPRLSRSR